MSNLKMNRDSQSGQILLIVVLTMVVALTVGLSVASRIITELRISKQNEESQRAFQAAEAGIQQALQQNGSVTNILDNDSNFSSILNKLGGLEIFVNGGVADVDQDTGADVWLSNYTDMSSPMSGSFQIHWGNPAQTSCNVSPDPSKQDPNIAAALEVVILEGPKDNPTMKKYFFEDKDCSRAGGTVASDVSDSGSFTVDDLSLTFRNRATITVSSGLVMKVIPIYNSTKVGLSGTNFPQQGSVVTSTGISGGTERKIRYYTSLPQLPIEVFPYSILSQ